MRLCRLEIWFVLIFVNLACSRPQNQSFENAKGQVTILPIVSPMSGTLEERLENAVHFSDLVTWDRVTLFHESESLMLGKISSAFKLNDNWVLFDGYTQQVFLADDSGNISQTIGAAGQGPGEYENIESVHRIWQDHIGVVNKGVIDVYDSNGVFIEEKSVAIGREIFHARGQISWQTKEWLYLCDFPSARYNFPAHGVFKYQDGAFIKHAAFGERLGKSCREKGFPPLGTWLFKEVAGSLWTSNPYRSEYEIYDVNGELFKTLPIAHSQLRDESDFVSLKSDEERVALLEQTCSPFDVFQMGPIIIATYAVDKQVFANAYSPDGQLIRKNLKFYSGLINPHDSYGSTMAFVSNSASSIESWTKYLEGAELEILERFGVNTKGVEGQPFIVEMKLIE